MNIAELLLRQARTRPESAAIIETRNGIDRTLTFAQLVEESARGAAVLRSAGLAPGSRALVLQPMGIDLYVALTALFRAGLVAVFLDPSAGRDHVARCCAMQPIHAFLGSRKAHLLRCLVPEVRRIPARWHFGSGWMPGSRDWTRGCANAFPGPDVHAATDDTPALLTFTSGSTGVPKAAVRTHGFLTAQHSALEESIGLSPGQVDLATLPIFVLANLASGVTSLLPDADLRRPGDVDPAPIVAQIRRHRPDRTGASPAFYERLLTTDASFPEFETIHTGGAPVFPDLMQRLTDRAPRARVVAVYGSTEAEPIAHVAWDQMDASDRAAMASGKGLLAGEPEACIAVRIVRERPGQPAGTLTPAEFDAERVPTGEAGEIVVRGAHVLPGYVGGVGDSETKIHVGDAVWHRTGDSGWMDEMGRLWLLGRTSARIADDRGVLHPFAVEAAVRAVPGIARAALVAHHGQRWLVVQARENEAVDRAALDCALGETVIDGITEIERIPLDRRHNAKVDYPELHRLLDAKRGAGRPD
ncbi:MAG: AMP-binding protein [Armatimonadota bacterium]